MHGSARIWYFFKAGTPFHKLINSVIRSEQLKRTTRVWQKSQIWSVIILGMVLQLSVAYYALSVFGHAAQFSAGGYQINLTNIILALSLVNTVKLAVLQDLGTKEFVEQKSYFFENASGCQYVQTELLTVGFVAAVPLLAAGSAFVPGC